MPFGFVVSSMYASLKHCASTSSHPKATKRLVPPFGDATAEWKPRAAGAWPMVGTRTQRRGEAMEGVPPRAREGAAMAVAVSDLRSRACGKNAKGGR